MPLMPLMFLILLIMLFGCLVVWLVVCVVGKDAPEGAGTYFQRRPTVTKRPIRMAVSMMVATTQRVPIWCLFMLVGCWLVVGCVGI